MTKGSIPLCYGTLSFIPPPYYTAYNYHVQLDCKVFTLKSLQSLYNPS